MDGHGGALQPPTLQVWRLPAHSHLVLRCLCLGGTGLKLWSLPWPMPFSPILPHLCLLSLLADVGFVSTIWDPVLCFWGNCTLPSPSSHHV